MDITGNLVNGTIRGSLTGRATLKGDLTGRSTLIGVLTYGSRNVEVYTGEYEVTPKAWEETVLPTADKLLLEDVRVFEIPYSAVANPSGGKTAIIGGI